ncbi:UrcA family protein [Caulobacter sp. NIBR2454]|uniref:UrcA family protein n=1 Tax=Caulobacter sp. NIBR2454 TaxID=3015996 RepID=UPI0022B6B970|nr:UrcA family protein [Caulobacter sp. NIBR2454]
MLKMLAPAAAFALIASVAVAAPATNSAVVKVGDLDPAKASTARIMEKRIEAAALTACGADEGSVALVKRSAQKSDCYKQAVAQTRTVVSRQLASN